MNDLKDPRLVEIEILSLIDRATFGSPGSHSYHRPSPRGVNEELIHEAVLHLAFDGAVIQDREYERGTSRNTLETHPNPTYPLDLAVRDTVDQLLTNASNTRLKITQRGRLRLYRLRDEILNRDRVRDDFGILWAKRHYLPDLEVRLRFRQPGEAISLILLDVDRLKLINTTFSHAGADEVLRGVFEVLRDKVQPADAYRLGGDEAGAVLPGAGKDEASRVAEDIRATVERTFAPKKMEGDLSPTVTLAVGTSSSPTSAEDFHRQVDAHLTKQKDQAGLRNTVHIVGEAT
jgi:diguanylate cyclase (GGDEF)-like protein